MRGISGLNGWSWIFILEGILTAVVAVSCYFFISNYPDTAGFLTERERKVIHTRLKNDGDATDKEAFDWSEVRRAVGDVKVWMYGLGFHTMSLPLYTLSLFMVSDKSSPRQQTAHADRRSPPSSRNSATPPPKPSS